MLSIISTHTHSHNMCTTAVQISRTPRRHRSQTTKTHRRSGKRALAASAVTFLVHLLRATKTQSLPGGQFKCASANAGTRSLHKKVMLVLLVRARLAHRTIKHTQRNTHTVSCAAAANLLLGVVVHIYNMYVRYVVCLLCVSGRI